MGNAYYSHIIEAKDGNALPVCKNAAGQEIALHSKYNPIREAESFAAQVDANCAFFVVIGLAGGYHIQKLREKCPECTILAVEATQTDIDFLSQIPTVAQFKNDKRIFLTDLASLKHSLLSLYKPALHGNATILSLRQWETLFSEAGAQARAIITETIKLLSADFSVQSHFGKIWQKNILSNLSLAEKTKKITDRAAKIDTKKTAAIIAAGPSLDNEIQTLKENRAAYFIIATDTAFSALLKQGIESDAVVSIDGQYISHAHYLEQLPKNTLYVFDLCATTASVRKALSAGTVIFAETGHPLAQYASFFDGAQNFLHLEAGSGTVTIAAASFAQALGFSNAHIQFFGADFSYIAGRPYARGTYLESSFYSQQNRFNTAEKSYTALMFRTATKKISEEAITTEILEAYKTSLADFMSRTRETNHLPYGTFNFKNFKSQYCKELKESFKNEREFNENTNAFTTLLPLCAKLGKGSAFLAYLKTLSYTESV